MRVQHIQWRLGCLIIYFVNLKGNKTGERANDPWHVYSEPKNPIIFPIIYLDKYLLSHPDILTTNSNLFPGNYQYEIFLNIFHKTVNGNIEEFQPLGVEKGTLVDRSFSNGAINIVAGGCTVSPPMYSFFLRDFGAWYQSNIDTYTMRRRVISLWDALLPVFIHWQHNLEYLWFIGILQTQLWYQNMKWWNLLKIILWEGQICIFQPSIFYNFYLHVNKNHRLW